MYTLCVCLHRTLKYNKIYILYRYIYFHLYTDLQQSTLYTYFFALWDTMKCTRCTLDLSHQSIMKLTLMWQRLYIAVQWNIYTYLHRTDTPKCCKTRNIRTIERDSYKVNASQAFTFDTRKAKLGQTVLESTEIRTTTRWSWSHP